MAAVLAATLISAALGADESPSPGVVVTWLRDAGRSPTPTPVATPLVATPTPVPTPTPTLVPTPTPAEVAGFIYPIDGACLPEEALFLPGAPREYRQGVHEGVDFFNARSCTFVGLDTEVVAAKAGLVIRADWAYQDLTAETAKQLMEAIERSAGTDPEALDLLRGRQVWVDHGDGIVTRYAHLNGIAGGIEVGARVGQGQVIAYVGESGTIDSLDAPGTQVHLHFEIRVGDSYLGQGLPPAAVRQLYQRAFSP